MTKSTKNAYKFTPAYQEAVNLSDGTPVTLRLVIPADKPLLERGIKRFHGSMLADNKPMMHLLHSVAQRICFDYQDAVLEFEVPLDNRTD